MSRSSFYLFYFVRVALTQFYLAHRHVRIYGETVEHPLSVGRKDDT